ncbi:hypothetical protein [Glaciimonas immobilis]|uniref:Uncharacterized protein n=1 Tax=Glaciimonas immobilis TaxID=728004 RepID=A0A840RQR7_9BURK|nr:hypothetical protein [Glaciimonas immobilis]KAF3997547.1 hypothetical protein HAV38_12780 [Glaciimonas immobilis]MBB5200767.1 hypothetical protein [Glaciimonas immobilis]
MDNKTLSLKDKNHKPDAVDHVVDQSADMAELAAFREDKIAREKAEVARIEAETKAATSVTMNLPPAAGKGITLGGRMYVHGHTYNVTNDIKWALEEQQNRCWAHESSLKESENKGRKQRRAYVS